MKTNFFTTVLSGTAVVSVCSLLLDPISQFNWSWNYLFWLAVSNLLIVFLMGLLIKNSIHNGWRLALDVFLVLFIIGQFSLLIEAYIFDVTDRSETLLLMVEGFALSILMAPALVFLFHKWHGSSEKVQFEKRSVLQWSWRIVLGDLLYVFFYLLAGFVLYAVYPKLMEFYSDKVPPFELMINTQFFRALLFIGICLIIAKTTKLTKTKKALLTGLIFSIIGGIAPLLMPGDEVMPGYIKFGHAFEVGISNFIYGYLLSILVAPKITAETSTLTSKPEILPS